MFDSLWATREHLAPALLFTGPQGIGKRAFAETLAAALLCEAKAELPRPCGHCAACHWLVAESHPDFRRLTLEEDSDGKVARDVKIAQVRALEGFLTVGGHRGGRRVVLIDPADALTTEAANALLKTLEEPGTGLIFLLVTARPSGLPLTVRSRCQVWPLKAPELEAAFAWLKAQRPAEPSILREALALAGGAPLAALAYSEPAWLAAHRQALEVIAELPETETQAAVDVLSAIPAQIWLAWLQRWLVDLSRLSRGAEPVYFPHQRARLLALSARVNGQGVPRAAAGLLGLSRLMDHPLNPRLFSEDALNEYLKAFRA